MKHRRAGFTLIELLIVIGIMMVLIVIAVLGLKSIGNTSRGRATKVSLENLKAMVTELDVTAGLSSLPTTAITAPADISESGADRFGNAVMQTNRVMTTLIGVPANKKVLSQFPAAQLGEPQWATGVDYLIGDRVVVIQTSPLPKLYFRCILAHTSAAGPPLAANANWAADTTTTPLILDAWNNPILFVPSRGMTGVMLQGQANAPAWVAGTSYPAGTQASIIVTGRTLNYVSLVGHLGAIANQPPTPAFWAGAIKAGDNRPFFASAGPDGSMSAFAGPDNTYWTADDIAAGDDNVYSFEN